MLCNCDFKSLEVIVAGFLSQDKVLCKEIKDAIDLHARNQADFGLPSRLIAKVFVFRILYGGGAYSFANDPEFFGVSREEKYWQGVIDAFYEKYTGIGDWHDRLLEEAMKTNRIQMPHGRFYIINPNYEKREPWPLTLIKNYPVQGFGADLVMLARLEARRRMREQNLRSLLVSTVHDSIVADCPEDEWKIVAEILRDSVLAVPQLCKKVFGVDFNLPTTSEVSFGVNMKDMEEYKFHL